MNPGIHYNFQILPGYWPLKLHFHWKFFFFLFVFFFLFCCCSKRGRKDILWLRFILPEASNLMRCLDQELGLPASPCAQRRGSHPEGILLNVFFWL